MIRLARLLLILTLPSAALLGCINQSSTDSIKPQNRIKVADLNTQIAIAYIRDGNYELALEKLNKAIAADPKHAAAYSTTGLLYNRVGEFEKAEKNFKKALRIESKNSSILNNYGQVLCQHGQYAKGQKMFLKANENSLYRTPEISLSNAGTCAMAADDTAAAETHFRAALKLNPRIATALLQMSSLSYDLTRYLPARAYFQRYLEVSNQSAQSLWLGIRIERELGDKDALSSYMLLLENEFPDSEEARLLLSSNNS